CAEAQATGGTNAAGPRTAGRRTAGRRTAGRRTRGDPTRRAPCVLPWEHPHVHTRSPRREVPAGPDDLGSDHARRPASRARQLGASRALDTLGPWTRASPTRRSRASWTPWRRGSTTPVGPWRTW